MDDIFRMPEHAIGLGKQYRMRDGAPPVSQPVPTHVTVTFLQNGRVRFADVADPSSGGTLTTREFREVYDPA